MTTAFAVVAMWSSFVAPRDGGTSPCDIVQGVDHGRERAGAADGIVGGMDAPFCLLFALVTFVAACDGTPSRPDEAGAPRVSPSGSAAATAAPHADDLTYGLRLTEQFAAALKQELQAGMTAGGPVKAIDVCQERAPQIAEAIDVGPGWQIRRTSLRARNPANTPDAWERATLERFEREHAGGAAAETLEAHEVVGDAGARELRYMKAIGTGPLCLTCHGKSLGADVAAALDERYPRDQARGFDVGDVRGAFSLRKKL